MSHLKALKLASASPASVMQDRSQRVRDRVIVFLREQKTMAEAKIGGTTFSATRTVWQKDEQGRRYPVEKPKRVRAGWFEGSDGKTYFSLRYAGTVIELAKDRNAVEVPTLAELPTIIEKLIEATKAGELDAQLNRAGIAGGILV